MFKKISRKSLLIILISLGILLLGTGIYFFVRQNIFKETTPEIDKYSEILDWCNYSAENKPLEINCKALLTNIRSIDDESCFDVKIITKEKNLENFSICGNAETLLYSNEILSYKSLMPISVEVKYVKQNNPNKYSFLSASISPVDNTYIQNFINEDIADLIGTDLSKISIQNIVDFCPKPESLPSYILGQNTSNYTQFFSSNKKNLSSYEKLYSSMVESNSPNILYPCNNVFSKLKTTSTLCSNISLENTSSILTLRDFSPKAINFTNTFSYIDLLLLKKISETNYELSNNINSTSANFEKIETIIKDMSMQDEINEVTYCSLYNLIEQIPNKNKRYINEMNTVLNSIRLNNTNITSPLCQSIISKENYDSVGAYIKIYFSNTKFDDTFGIYNRCLNLTNLFDE